MDGIYDPIFETHTVDGSTSPPSPSPHSHHIRGLTFSRGCSFMCVCVSAVPAYRKRTDPKVWLVLNRLYSRWQIQDGSDTALNARRCLPVHCMPCTL